jgi:small subunit ribosomal protein S9
MVAKKKRKTKKKSKEKVVVARGKRKECKARARIRKGKGDIRINRKSLRSFNNRYVRETIREPLTYIGPEANEIDISVSVTGGGVMGQAQAARTAIAKALVAYFDKMDLKEKFISIDRSLVVEDTRRVESKKYKGPKARARYQKSYR